MNICFMKSPFFKFDERLLAVSGAAQRAAKSAFDDIDRITEYNQQKVLAAFIDNRVSETHFVSTTGYGYGDRGRDTLDVVFAQVMGAQDALVRHSIVSGTHAIAIALFGVLRPNDTLLTVTGAPYDTLEKVIGLDDSSGRHEDIGSLRDYGINYKQIELNSDGLPDLP
ncbi:MAG: methionine gamma-lyase family protein [Oscillospiraceae bacterium]|nr:methionine gamma-lyase family protein [Oscillospiraceae bacterium]